jgi:hypothetical protein
MSKSIVLVLATPNFDEPFTIQCDASNQAAGAVLTQGQGDNERVFAFLSKKFTDAPRKYAATEYGYIVFGRIDGN